MSAVYRTLYEKYEQNDVLHVGIQEVVEAEKPECPSLSRLNARSGLPD